MSLPCPIWTVYCQEFAKIVPRFAKKIPKKCQETSRRLKVPFGPSLCEVPTAQMQEILYRHARSCLCWSHFLHHIEGDIKKFSRKKSRDCARMKGRNRTMNTSR